MLSSPYEVVISGAENGKVRGIRQIENKRRYKEAISYQTDQLLWLTLMLKNEKYKGLVLSMVTVPSLVAFSVAVTKKAEKIRLFMAA